MGLKILMIDITYEEKLAQLLLPFFDEESIQKEYKFHSKRRWRFDLAIPSLKLAFEIEGGTWRGGRHVNPIGFAKDCEKYNAATRLGWSVFRLVPSMLEEEYIESLFFIEDEEK